MPIFEERTESVAQWALAGLAIASGGQVGADYGLLPALARVDSSLANLATTASLALLSAWLFNLMVVVYPDLAKRRRLRRWLAGRHERFKDDLNIHYHDLIGLEYEEETIVELRDPEFWATYFNVWHSDHHRRWHAVHNALYDWGLPEIKSLCTNFESDCNMATLMAGEINQSGAQILSKVKLVSSRASLAEPEYDTLKSLLWMLAQLHSPSRMLGGKNVEDPFSDEIRSI